MGDVIEMLQKLLAAAKQGAAVDSRRVEDCALDAIDEILCLKAESAVVWKDAERYRWLRSEGVNTDPRYFDFWLEFSAKLCREGRMDALIDSAIAAQEDKP